MRGSRVKAMIRYCAAAVLVIGAILLNLPNDRFRIDVDERELVCTGEIETSNAGRYIDAYDGYSGLFARTGFRPVQRGGDFRLVLQMHNGGDDNTVEVVGSERSGEETVLFSGSLRDGEEYASFPFEIGEEITAAEVRVYFGGTGNMNLFRISMVSETGYADTAVTAVFAAVAFALAGWYLSVCKWMLPDRVHRRLTDYAVLIAAAIFLSQALFADYLTVGHDLEFHLSRIENVKEMLPYGMFPVRNYLAGGAGFGSATPLFYPDLFLYFPALLRAAGCSQHYAYTVFLIAVQIATAFIAYFGMKVILKGRFAALLAALLYLAADYRLVNIYTRAAVGEMLAMTFLPLALAGLYEIFFGDRKRWGLAVAGFSGVIQAHSLSTLMLGCLSVLFGVLFLRRVFRERRWVSLLSAAGLTLGLNLWFLLPYVTMNLSMTPYVVQADLGGAIHSIYPAVLFGVFAGAGAGMSKAGVTHPDLIPGAGFAIMLGAVVCLVLLLAKGKKRFDGRDRLAAGCLTAGAVFLWVATYHFRFEEFSGLFQPVGDLLRAIQFPWRFFVFASLFLSVAAAAGFAMFAERAKSRLPVLLTVVAAIALSSGYYLQTVKAAEPVAYIPSSHALDFVDYYDSLEVLVNRQRAERKPVFSNPLAAVTAYSDSPKGITIAFENGVGAVEFPRVWYPGYTAWDQDGEQLPTAVSVRGFVAVGTEEDTESVTLRYTGLWYWTAGDILSLAVALVLAAGWLLRRINRRKRTGVRRAAGKPAGAD